MVILGLGSNIGDRLGYLRSAVERLGAFVTDIRCSSILESPAMLPPNAPPDSDHPFYNMVITGNTTLSPQALFAEIKKIEQDLGRIKRFVWGPREIDIDIIAMDDLIVESEHLHIPHKGMLKRDFVMLPLAQVAPDWCCPHSGKIAKDIVKELGFALSDTLVDTGLVIHAR